VALTAAGQVLVNKAPLATVSVQAISEACGAPPATPRNR
jgi:hypothetical protein